MNKRSYLELTREEGIASVTAGYHDFLKEDMAKGEYPSYRASGMSYIRFAKEERELFKLEMWAYVHGIAAMTATSYPVLIVTCHILQYHGSFPVILNYLITLAVGVALTFVLYETVRRIPIIRYLVLGQRGSTKSKAGEKNHSEK